jgi:Rv0078B-related antitoxin
VNMQISFSHIEVLDDATADMLRQKTPEQRLSMAFAMNRTARHLIAGGIRWQHPDWNEVSVQEEVVRRMTRGTG